MKTSNAAEVLSAYLNFSPQRDLRADREKGRLDGFAEQPPSDQEGFSNYELTIIHEIKSHLNRYKRWVQEEFDEVRATLRSRERMRDEVYRSRRDDLTNDLNSKLDELSARTGPHSVEYQNAESAHEDARRRLAACEERLRRPPRMHLRRPKILGLSPYLAILAFLAVLEMPVNIPIFETVFDTIQLFAILGAFGMGIVFIFIAHLLGILLSRISERDPDDERGRRSKLGLWLGVVVILSVALATIAVLSTGRLQDVADLVTQGVGLNVPVADLQPITIPVFGIEFPRDPLILFLFSLAVFLVGVMLSFLRHDPNRDYEGYVEADERAEAKLVALQQQWEVQRSRLMANYRTDLREINTRIDEEQNAIDREAAKLETLRSQYRENIHIVKEVARARINAYQEGNTETRQTQSPAYFGEAGMARLESLLAREVDGVFSAAWQPPSGHADGNGADPDTPHGPYAHYRGHA